MRHIIGLSVLVSVGLFGDPLSLTSTGSFNPIPSSFFSQPNLTPTSGQGNPFWDNYSFDSIGSNAATAHDANVGYVLTDTGALAGTMPVLGTDSVNGTYTTSNGGDPTQFNFLSTGTIYNVQLLFAASAQNSGAGGTVGNNGITFGWFDIVGGSLDKHVLFSNIANTDSPTVSTTFNPTVANFFDPGAQTLSGEVEYGFYATECTSYNGSICTAFATFYTDSQDNTVGNTWNHFALFNLNSSSQNYAIGFTGETNNSCPTCAEADGDYNDVVVDLTALDAPVPPGDTPSVPEPASLGIMGAGLIGIGITGRRLRKKKN